MQFKAIKPVGDRVLVKVDKEDMKSIGGVLLPSSASKKPTAGQIVSIGDVTLVKVRREDISRAIGVIAAQPRRYDFQVFRTELRFVGLFQGGERVVYSKFAGTELEVDGGEHVLLKVREHGVCMGAGCWPEACSSNQRALLTTGWGTAWAGCSAAHGGSIRGWASHGLGGKGCPVA